MLNDRINLDVIKALATGNIDKDILKAYTGWGGLKKNLNTPSFYSELKNYLSDAEILTIKKTLGNAYYTPQTIIESMYNYLSILGFKGGNILEPSAGNGAFIEYMPKDIKKNSKIYAVELEPISAKILSHLYPNITVKNCGFQEMDIKPVFDLVLGNPPYGSEKLFDQYHLDLNDLVIHHYFVAKSMRLLKEGGLLAMVLPSYFLDNKTAHARDLIAKEGGVLVDAFRLPDDLFERAKVTVDLVFFKKGGQCLNDWVNVSQIRVNNEKFCINDFYLKNPANVIGDLSYVWLNQYQRNQLTCVKNGDTFAKLKKIVCSKNDKPIFSIANTEISKLVAIIDAKIESLKTKKHVLLNLENKIITLAQEIECFEI